MFDWLQHLFITRAMERENAELRLKITQLESEITELKKVIAIKDEEIRCFNEHFSRTKIKRPRIAQGIDYPIFGE